MKFKNCIKDPANHVNNSITKRYDKSISYLYDKCHKVASFLIKTQFISKYYILEYNKAGDIRFPKISLKILKRKYNKCKTLMKILNIVEKSILVSDFNTSDNIIRINNKLAIELCMLEHQYHEIDTKLKLSEFKPLKFYDIMHDFSLMLGLEFCGKNKCVIWQRTMAIMVSYPNDEQIYDL